MPPKFTKCIAEGGKIRTKTISKDKYMKVCIKGGKSVGGHVKTKKGKR